MIELNINDLTSFFSILKQM